MLRRRLPCVVLALALVACGSEDEKKGDDGDAGSAAGGTSSSGGSTSGGGATSGGAGGGGSPASGAGGGLVGLEQTCAEASGTRLPAGPCFKACSYAGAKEPFYDEKGDCSHLGYKCSQGGYCIPNIHCSTDPACESQGGPGWKCVTTVGPYVGQCLLGCAGDTDCPASPTPSPYLCKPIDAVPVCRF